MRCEAKSTRVIGMPARPISLLANSFVPQVRPFMPRDNDKDNDSRGRRDRPSGGKGRSGAARGPEKKFAKRGFGKSEGGKRPYAGNRNDRPPRRRDDDAAPRRDYGDRPRPARFERD